MSLKRPIFLISGTVLGTVGVLSYVPGSLNAPPLLALSPATQSATGQSAIAQGAPAQTSTAQTKTATAPTQSATTPTSTSGQSTAKSEKKATTKVKAKATAKARATTSAQPPTQTPTQTQSPTQAPTAAPATSTRTIAGSTIQTPFGPVQVQITVQGTKITNATALQIPQGGRSTFINSQAVPWLIRQTLAAQSASIDGVGGATYTTQSWIQSLQAALSKM